MTRRGHYNGVVHSVSEEATGSVHIAMNRTLRFAHQCRDNDKRHGVGQRCIVSGVVRVTPDTQQVLETGTLPRTAKLPTTGTFCRL
ncbi:hypothetical protein C0Q70_20122 [Pomacea canaliculata]|uniref:Uncharacterized protein n=1 Tax=Pomacea canaliculata TaxID=400727 RepID=A0A2T7NES8_POMCA|nr:hypothetical protein C0Q70_20122 [Pomacea canaliculata]